MLNYKIALINVFWDEQSIDNRLFVSENEQQLYFDKLTMGKFTNLVNFSFSNNVETRIMYRDSSGRDTSELLKCNYAVVHKFNDFGEIIERRYFFANVNFVGGGTVELSLSLDDIQTNYIRYRNEFGKVFVKRATLNRYLTYLGRNQALLDFTATSPFYQTQDIAEHSQYMTEREQIAFKFTGDSAIDDWLNYNVAYWVYGFCDGTHVYKFYDIINSGAVSNSDNLNLIHKFYDSQTNVETYGIVCYPVYKDYSSNKIRCKTSKDAKNNYVFDKVGFLEFQKNNNGTSFIYNVKVSLIPPFTQILENMSIDSNGDLLIDYSNSGLPSGLNGLVLEGVNGISCTARVTAENGKRMLFTAITQYAEPIQSYPVSNVITEFSKEQAKNDNICPTLYSPKFSGLTVKSFDGNVFAYDYQKMQDLGNRDLVFLYNETLQPEITKYYFRLQSQGLYSYGTEENLLGLVGSTDTTISISNDQYAQFLANNKNFWLQTNLNLAGNLYNRVASKESASSLLSAVGESGLSLFDKVLSVNNMRESPDAMKNGGGNMVFSGQICSIGFFVERYDTLGIEKEAIIDYHKRVGYALNKYVEITEVDNIRVNYDYLAVDIDVVPNNLSNVEKERLKLKFSQGVRLWHKDFTIFNLDNNFEKVLEEV